MVYLNMLYDAQDENLVFRLYHCIRVDGVFLQMIDPCFQNDNIKKVLTRSTKRTHNCEGTASILQLLIRSGFVRRIMIVCMLIHHVAPGNIPVLSTVVNVECSASSC